MLIESPTCSLNSPGKCTCIQVLLSNNVRCEGNAVPNRNKLTAKEILKTDPGNRIGSAPGLFFLTKEMYIGSSLL